MEDSFVKKKNAIILQIVEFLQYQRTLITDTIYSVKTGKEYKSFLNFLTYGAERKIMEAKKNEQAKKIVFEISSIIRNLELRNLFVGGTEFTLVHGDLIIHNFLATGSKLTGVLDWELAFYGDPDYDFFRLLYYQECARAYQEQGIDKTFETDYTNELIAAICHSNLVEDIEVLQKKYQFVRAIFYLNALHWATNSDNPTININEVIIQWDNSSGAKYVCT